MIIYNPLDGDALTTPIPSKPKHCFLMTRLGKPVPPEVDAMRDAISAVCLKFDYSVIDAATTVTGRDFLIKIWRLIAATPLSVGIVHQDIPAETQANIYYELGVAQALGKETVIVKSAQAKVSSDFVRTEYIEFSKAFPKQFGQFLEGVKEQADHYEMIADQLERNPLLAIDYLKRAFLITGQKRLRDKAKVVLRDAGLEGRAKNSVEILASNF